jgi:hypothetical protein
MKKKSYLQIERQLLMVGNIPPKQQQKKLRDIYLLFSLVCNLSEIINYFIIFDV